MSTIIDDYGGSNAVEENINDYHYKFGDISKTVGGILGGTPETIPNPAVRKIFFKEEAIEETPPEMSESERLEKELADSEEKQYQRELEERAHAEEREDTAYQRAIKDMRAAGWNTDGIGAQASPAAVRLDTTRSEAVKNRRLELQKLYKQLAVAISEGDKDRANAIITSIISLGGTVAKISALRP